MTNPNNPTAKAVAHPAAPDLRCYECGKRVIGNARFCDNCGAKPSIGKAIKQLLEEKLMAMSIENLSDAIRQHRRNELHREWHEKSLEGPKPEVAPPYPIEGLDCTADLDSPCECPRCEKERAESMDEALSTYPDRSSADIDIMADEIGYADDDECECGGTYDEDDRCSDCSNGHSDCEPNECESCFERAIDRAERMAEGDER